MIDGEAAIEVGTPAAVELSWICQACAPGVAADGRGSARAVRDHDGLAGGTGDAGDGDRLPGHGQRADRRGREAGPAEVAGGVHPAGTATVSEPFSIPPVAAVYVSVTVRPAWLAETTEIDDTAVPAPSAA